MLPIWPYIAIFIGPTLTFIATLYWTRNNRTYTESKEKQAKEVLELKEWQRRMEEGAASRDKALKELNANFANHDQRLTGFQQEIERVADAGDKRCSAIERDLTEVPRIREDMASMKAEVKHIVDGLGKLETKIDRLFELLSKNR